MTFTAFFELSWDVVWNPGTFPPVIIKKWDTKKQLLSHKNENIIEGFFFAEVRQTENQCVS